MTDAWSVDISVRFMGDRLPLAETTALMGVEPICAYNKGDMYASPGGRRAGPGRTGLWLYQTKRQCETKDIADHYEIARRLLADSEKIREFLAQNDAKLDTAVFWYGPPGSTLPPENPEYAALVEAAGGIVYYHFDNDDD